MLSNNFEEWKKAEINAIKSLQNSFLILGTLELLFILIQILSYYSCLIGLRASTERNNFLWISYVIVFDVVYILFLFSFYDAFRKGISLLNPFTRVGFYPIAGALMLLIGAGITVPGYLLSITNGVYSGSSFIDIAMIGVSISLAGKIMIAMGIWKLGKRYKSDALKLSSILPILFGFVGDYIMYIMLDDGIRWVTKRLPPAPKPPWLK